MEEFMNQAVTQTSVEQNQPTTEQIIKRLAEVESTLQLLKKLYEEKEQLTLQLMERVGLGTEVTEGDYIFSVVDNFATKNAVFRPAAVRRFELEVDSQFARNQKAAKEAAKKAKKNE